MSNRCRNCNFENQPGSLHCNQCGDKLEAQTQCDNCQVLNTIDANYCKSCGQSLISGTSVDSSEIESEQTGPDIDSVSIPAVSKDSDISGSGWQPDLGTETIKEDATSESECTSKVKTSPLPVSHKSGFFSRRKNSPIDQQGSQILQGEVRGFKERRDNTSKGFGASLDRIVWSFRLERYQDGQRLPPIPVEIIGQQFVGSINEGDTVRLRKKKWGGGTYSTKRVFSVTNNTDVIAKKKGWSISIHLFGVFAFAVMAFVVGSFIYGLTH